MKFPDARHAPALLALALVTAPAFFPAADASHLCAAPTPLPSTGPIGTPPLQAGPVTIAPQAIDPGVKPPPEAPAEVGPSACVNPSATAFGGHLDTRCDLHSCAKIRLDDDGDGAEHNVLDTTAAGGAPSLPLHWGAHLIWTAGTDGPGSGLEADLLDGLTGAQLLRSDQDGTLSGSLTLTGGLEAQGDLSALGNVGIGTTSPASRLHVAGDTRLAGDVSIHAPDPRLTLEPTGSFDAFELLVDETGSGIHGLLLRDATVARLLAAFLADGRVGIGTGTPAETLHVRGDSAATLALDGTGGGGKAWVLRSGADGSLRVEDATLATPALLTLVNGDVGVGTSTPNPAGHAGRFLSVAGPQGAGLELSTTAPANNLDPLAIGAIHATHPDQKPGHESLAAIEFLNDGSAFRTSGGSILLKVKGSESTGLAEAARVHSSGNVGIGTAAPPHPLSVVRDLGFADGYHAIASFVRSHASTEDEDGVSLGYFADGAAATGGGVMARGAKPLHLGTVSQRQALTILESDGSVGIGTTTPGARLHVLRPAEDGSGVTEGLRLQSTATGAGDGVAIAFHGGDPAKTTQLSRIAGAWGDGGSAGLLTFHTKPDGGALAERVRIDPDGNVGIGTSTPNARLHVEGGNVRIGGLGEGLDLDRGSGTGYVRWTDGDGIPRWTLQRNAGGENEIRLHANDFGGQRFVVSRAYDAPSALVLDLDTGRVGVGTAKPAALLDVASSGTAGSGVAPLLHLRRSIASPSPGDGQALEFHNPWSSAEPRAGIAMTYGDTHDRTHLGFFTRSDGQYAEHLRVTYNGNVGIGTVEPQAGLHVAAGGLRVDGTALLAGAVGVGTSDPSHLLHVAGAARVASTFFVDHAAVIGTPAAGTLTAGDALNLAGNARFVVNTDEADTSPTLKLEKSGKTLGALEPGERVGEILWRGGWHPTNPDQRIDAARILVEASQPTGHWGGGDARDADLAIHTALDGETAERVRVTAAGNVGIGTPAPSERLDVHGRIRLIGGEPVVYGGDGVNSFGGIRLYDVDLGNTEVVSGRNGQASIVFRTGNAAKTLGGGDERMRIAAAGNVGIGTAEPSARLHVAGASGQTSVLVQDATENGRPRVELANNAANWYVQLDGAQGNRFEVVGPGHNTWLAIEPGDGRTSLGPLQFARIQSETEDVAQILAAYPGGDFAFATRADGPFVTRMTIENGGRVGIGTSAPTAKLTVAGDILASGPITANAAVPTGDVAEPVVGDGLEPGDVVVLDGFDATGKARVKKAGVARSDQVVGVVSTNPSLRLAGLATDVPLAVTGIVPVKVVGPVAAGNLLATSDVPGRAMACLDAVACYGRTIGKAMEALAAGEGVVRVMVAMG